MTNPQVVIWKTGYDWFWIRDLSICLYAKKGTPWRQTLIEMMPHRPRLMALWDAERLQGGLVYWLPPLKALRADFGPLRCELDFLPWTAWQNRVFETGIAVC